MEHVTDGGIRAWQAGCSECARSASLPAGSPALAAFAPMVHTDPPDCRVHPARQAVDSGSIRANGSGHNQDRLGRRLRRRLRPEPSRRKPASRYGELAPTAIQADANVWRRSDGRMAERARPITIEADFSRNGGESFRAAFRTSHGSTSARLHWEMADRWGGLNVAR